MYEVRQTTKYRTWFEKLKDSEAQKRVLARLRRLSQGNLGDCRSVGGKVHELRIDYGPGYRVYLTFRERVVVLLLTGGDKRSQDRDIAAARKMVEEL